MDSAVCCGNCALLPGDNIVEKSIQQIYEEALQALGSAPDIDNVKALSIRYLGRKGAVTKFLRNISSQPAEKRAAIGKKANQVKKALDKAFKAAILDGCWS